MIVAVDLPAVGDDFEDVGLAVAVGVLDAADVRPLGDVEPAVFLSQAEDFVHAVGEARELGFFGIGGVSVVDHPDFAAASADGNLAVGHDLDGPGFEHLTLRKVEAEDLVVVVLGFSLGRSFPGLCLDRTRCCEDNSQYE